MLREPHIPVLANSDLESVSANPACSVLIAHQDSIAGAHAMDICRMLLSKFSDELQFRISIWSFDYLQQEIPALQAIRDAIGADIVIVSARAQDELSPATKHWIETWIPEKRGQMTALLALLNSDFEESGLSPVEAYLKNAASNASMDFFPKHIYVAATAPALNSPFLTPLAPIPVQQLDEPAPDGWGIND